MLYMLFNTCLSTYVCVYVCIEISGVFPLLGSSVANEWGMVHVGSCCAGSALGLEAGCGAGVSRQKSTLMRKELIICLGVLGKPWALSSQMQQNPSSQCSCGVFGSEMQLGSVPHL